MISNRKSSTLIVATVAVLCVAYGPMLVDFFRNQWAHPQYQYFPFVLGAFAWLLWQRCKQAAPQPTEAKASRFPTGTSLIVGAWILLALSYLANSPWLTMISMILLVAGCFVGIERDWKVQYLWGIWLLLWLIVPLPLNRDDQLTTMLQRYSSRLSSAFLDSVGVCHLMDGNTLSVPGRQFFVDEACSGIVSVLSIIACAVIYGVWRNRPPVHLLLLAIAGVGWATLMNVMRITTIAIAYDRAGLDWSEGTPHEILGLVVFTVTFLMLICTDFFLVAALEPVSAAFQRVSGHPLSYGAWLAAGWDKLGEWGAPQPQPAIAAARANSLDEMSPRFTFALVPLVAFGALAGTQVGLLALSGNVSPNATASVEHAINLDATALPPTVAAMNRVGTSREDRAPGDVFGKYSRIFEYRDDQDHLLLASCDFPFGPDWHELIACYLGIGWQLQSREAFVVPAELGQEPWDYVEARFTKPDGSSAFLAYCVFDEYGNRLHAPSRSLWDDLKRAFTRRKTELSTVNLFQVQVFTTASGKMQEGQEESARKLLRNVREPLRKLVTEKGAPAVAADR